MAKNNDLSAQAKQLGEQALKLAQTARVQAGRYAQDNASKIDAAIDKAAAAVERKTGKNHRGTAAKVKDAAAKSAAYLANDAGAPRHSGPAPGAPRGGHSGPQDRITPAATWPDAQPSGATGGTAGTGGTGGRAEMPTIPTSPLSDLPGDGTGEGRPRDAGSGI